jgi:hypothetical protein
MAKKRSAAEFNMSEGIREILSANQSLTAKEVYDALSEKNPGAKINRNSFSVAFYTCRKKLGLGSKRRGARRGRGKAKAASAPGVNLAALRTAARFLSEVGGAEAAMEAIKQVQTLQVK